MGFRDDYGPGAPAVVRLRRPGPILSGCPYFVLALAASHFAWVISTKSWPLQEFLALLQADLPLQEFTPSHLTLASSAATAVVTKAVENITAAAAARATLDIFRLFIMNVSSSLWRYLVEPNAARPVA